MLQQTHITFCTFPNSRFYDCKQKACVTHQWKEAIVPLAWTLTLKFTTMKPHPAGPWLPCIFIPTTQKTLPKSKAAARPLPVQIGVLSFGVPHLQRSQPWKGCGQETAGSSYGGATPSPGRERASPGSRKDRTSAPPPSPAYRGVK